MCVSLSMFVSVCVYVCICVYLGIPTLGPPALRRGSTHSPGSERFCVKGLELSACVWGGKHTYMGVCLRGSPLQGKEGPLV
jgi:hypothetical protein